jgi:hypothetical protein
LKTGLIFERQLYACTTQLLRREQAMGHGAVLYCILPSYAFCSGQGRNCCPDLLSDGPHVARDRRPINSRADHGHWAGDFKSTCKQHGPDRRERFLALLAKALHNLYSSTVLILSLKGCNYDIRANLSVSRLTKFLVNSIHIYGLKSIYYENIFRN